MDQEYLEDKVLTLRKLTGYRRLREVLGLLMLVVAVYLVIALLSFDRADPSWSQTAWHEPIRNAGGRFGAWCADILFSVFGVVAYILPVTLFIYCWNVFKQRYSSNSFDYFTLSLKTIGFLALILSSCSLADINFDDWYNFSSGGVLGSLISSAIIPKLNHTGATLILLFMWAIGLTLFTGWSWLTISEKIGAIVISVASFILNKLRSKNGNEVERNNEKNIVFQSDEINNQQNMDVDDALLSNVNIQDELNDEYYVPDNQLALNLEPGYNDNNIGNEKKTSIKFVPQYPPIQTEPTITDLTPHLVQDKADEKIEHQQTPDRISQIINSMAKNQSVNHDNQLTEPQTDEKEDPLLGQSNHVTHTTTIHVTSVANKPLFTPAKTKVIPDLPRPNPVRIPTRRELMSYGIQLPSQKNTENHDSSDNALPENDHRLTTGFNEQLDEEILRQQFVEQQKERYGSEYELEKEQPDNSESMLHRTEPDLTESTVPPSHYQTHIVSQPATVPVTTNEQEVKKQVLLYEYKDSFNPVPAKSQNKLNDSDVYGFIDKDEVVLNTGYKVEQNTNSAANARIVEMQKEKQSANQNDEAEISQLQPINPDNDDSLLSANLIAKNEPESTIVDERPMQDKRAPNIEDGLIHPFLVRNDQPLHKPTTPLPTLDLLTSPPASIEPVDVAQLEQIARLIEDRLADYRVKASVVDILPGPVITLYELDLAPGVKAARISNLSRDLARSLSTVAVRVVEVIPGRPYVGLELPNKHRQTVYLREVLDCAKFRDIASPLAIVLGKDISGQPVVADLAKMPHVLVAGTTGSGKSVGVNAMIISMLYKATPDDVRFIMIDPKMLELSVYEGIPHLLTEVVTDMKDAANALRWCVGEMERRYKLMSALGVRNLAGYNERIQQAIDMGRPVPDPFWKPTESMDISCPTLEKLPYVVVIVDEFADLMMAVGKKVEELIARLAQKARAAGIHLVLATQRPSVDVITGLIKANIPTRIAFTVSSKIDSRTILDQGGAESLLGMGDMLYMAPNSSMPVRVHGAFVRDEEVHAVVNDWKARGKPQYIESITSTTEESENGFSFDADEDLDPLFDQAVAFVVEKRKPSISGVQRQFRIGYNRAARIIEQMEAQGIVSPPGNNGNREVLAPPPHDL